MLYLVERVAGLGRIKEIEMSLQGDDLRYRYVISPSCSKM